MGLTAERGEKRRGRWKEREIFLTSGWEEEEEDGNGTFGGKKKTERWAAKGRTRDTDKEEEEERLSFFFLSFWMLEGIRLFSQGQNVAENTSEKRGLFKGNLKWALGFIAWFVFFSLYVPFLIIFRLRLLLPSFLFLFSLSISSLCLIGRENGGGGRKGILCFCGVLRIGTFLVSRKKEKKGKYNGFFVRMCLSWGGKGFFYTEPLYRKVIVSTIWQCTEREILRSPFPASQYLCSTSVLLHSHSFCRALRIYCTISPPDPMQEEEEEDPMAWEGGWLDCCSLYPPTGFIEGARNSTKVAPTVGVLNVDFLNEILITTSFA